MNISLFVQAKNALCTGCVETKLRLTAQLAQDWQAGVLTRVPTAFIDEIKVPGRPVKPELVAPRELNKRKITNPTGHRAMIHAVAHIEFNAINLALDAVYRFQDMPDDYYSDWTQIAKEEAEHFQLLNHRLQQLDTAYGDFQAHNGLWEMAVSTQHDILSRMALVPRVMEARGVDVTPGIIKKFEAINDQETVTALNVILRDEVGHVAAGSHWFKVVCAERKLDSEETFFQMIRESSINGKLRGPFSREARLLGGFTESEMARLESGLYDENSVE